MYPSSTKYHPPIIRQELASTGWHGLGGRSLGNSRQDRRQPVTRDDRTAPPTPQDQHQYKLSIIPLLLLLLPSHKHLSTSPSRPQILTMGYGENICQLCAVSINVSRVRAKHEPPSAGWGYSSPDFYSGDPMESRCTVFAEDSGCENIPHDRAEWMHLAGPGCTFDGGYNGWRIKAEEMKVSVLRCVVGISSTFFHCSHLCWISLRL